jgi:hypothetical protein
VRGTVVETGTRKPQSGLVVQLCRATTAAREVVAETRTTEGGEFTFAELEPGSYAVSVEIEGDTPMVGEARAADLGEGEEREVTLEVERRYFISGTLLEADGGRPLAGVMLTLRRFHGYRSPDDLHRDLGETGPDGRFRSSHPVYGGHATLVVHKGAEGLYADFMSHGIVLKQLNIGSENVTDLALTFPWTGAVKGRVLDPGGVPIVGARVVALDPVRNYHGPMDRDARLVATAEDGRFFLDRLPCDRPLVVEVTTAGLGRTISKPFEARSGELTPEIVVTMNRIACLRVHVVDASGEAVVGAAVHATPIGREIEPASEPPLTDEQRGVAMIEVCSSVRFGSSADISDTKADGTVDLELAPGATS